MTRDDAVTITAMVVNSWPGPVWEVERMEAYIDALLPLDAAVTTNAVARAVSQLKYRPSIAELREFVRIERSLSAEEEIRFMPSEMPLKPTWVERWERARAAGDVRPFPEQMTGMDQIARQSPEHYAVYTPPRFPLDDAEHWVQGDEYL
jgi:hypothetical protein